MAARPETIAELTAHGWELAERQLAGATEPLALVTHWFVTPHDSSVNADPHFGSDARTARLLGVVVPTLIDQLGATLAVVAVPWELDGALPLLALVALLPGEPAALEARALERVAGAFAAPWWKLGEQRLTPPAELAAIAAGLRIPA